MKIPFLQPGDEVRLHNGQIKRVKEQLGGNVYLEDDTVYTFIQVSLVLMRPIHLAIHLCNINGPIGLARWKRGRSQGELISYITSNFLMKHYEMLKKVLECYGPPHCLPQYTWENTFANDGLDGLNQVAEEVLQHIDRLIAQHMPSSIL